MMQFFKGREAIKIFLRRKWEKELDYALMKVGGRVGGIITCSDSDNSFSTRQVAHNLRNVPMTNTNRTVQQQELWAFSGNRISARFEYEWHDENGQWLRSHGNEQWQFTDKGRWWCIFFYSCLDTLHCVSAFDCT